MAVEKVLVLVVLIDAYTVYVDASFWVVLCSSHYNSLYMSWIISGQTECQAFITVIVLLLDQWS